MGGKTLNYNEYIASDVWKCKDSPSGAHYWVQMVETEKLAGEGYFCCKYCHDVRKFPLTFHDTYVKQKGGNNEQPT